MGRHAYESKFGQLPKEKTSVHMHATTNESRNRAVHHIYSNGYFLIGLNGR
jgi:hypothetical protein